MECNIGGRCSTGLQDVKTFCRLSRLPWFKLTVRIFQLRVYVRWLTQHSLRSIPHSNGCGYLKAKRCEWGVMSHLGNDSLMARFLISPGEVLLCPVIVVMWVDGAL